MVTQLGMSDNIGNIDLSSLYKELSTETRQRIEDEVRSMIDTSYVRATQLLRTKRKELDLLANALVEYEVLDLKEVQQILKGEKLKRIKGDRKKPMQIAVSVPSVSGDGGGDGGGSGGGGSGPGVGVGVEGPGPKGIGISGIGEESGAGETTPGVPGQGGPSVRPPPSVGERVGRKARRERRGGVE